MRPTPFLLLAAALALLVPTVGALGEVRVAADSGHVAVAVAAEATAPAPVAPPVLASPIDAAGDAAALPEATVEDSATSALSDLGTLTGFGPLSQAAREVLTLVPAAMPDPAHAPTLEPELPYALGPADAHASAQAAGASPGATPTATAVGGLALAWLLLEKLGVGRAMVALYFRVQAGELLENERRERVLQLVRERPGIGPTEIADDLGTAWGVTSYHLDRLERAGLVASQRSGHHRCYFLPGAMPKDQRQTVALFRGDTTRRVAQLVAQRPGIPQSQLCQELGLSASAASKQLARLVATGLIRRDHEAGGLRLFPTASLTAAM